jgi:hypothetical protein
VPVLAVSRDGEAVVSCVQFSFLLKTAGSSSGSVFAYRKADSLAVLSPFKVVSPFWVSFRLAVVEN